MGNWSDGKIIAAVLAFAAFGLLIEAASVGTLFLIALGCLVFAAIVWITWEASG